jgi:xanthine/uracil permease
VRGDVRRISQAYARNNGVIQITGVASRRVGAVMVVKLALLGLFPVVGQWICRRRCLADWR